MLNVWVGVYGNAIYFLKAGEAQSSGSALKPAAGRMAGWFHMFKRVVAMAAGATTAAAAGAARNAARCGSIRTWVMDVLASPSAATIGAKPVAAAGMMAAAGARAGMAASGA